MSIRTWAYWGAALVIIILGALYYMYASQNVAPHAAAPVPIANPFGQITSVSGGKLTLKSVSGTLIVDIAPNAIVRTGTTNGNSSSLAVGQIVTIASSTSNTDGSLTATLITVIPPPPPPPPSK